MVELCLWVIVYTVGSLPLSGAQGWRRVAGGGSNGCVRR